MSAVEHALGYARGGFGVFPVDPASKRPRTAHGFKDASVDERTVRRMFGAAPGAGVGIATGGHTRLVVVDVDVPEGIAGMAEAVDRLGPLPDTPTVRTPSGGRHLYLVAPVGPSIASSAGRLAAGVDVRAAGGYVVAPPTRGYVWTARGNRAGLPEAWAAAMRPPPPPAAAPRPPGVSALAGPGDLGLLLDVLRVIPATQYVPALAGVSVPEAGGAIRCPLPGHEDRTPSCHVYPSDDGWFCFGCNRGGGVIDLAAHLWGRPTRGAGFPDLAREVCAALMSPGRAAA